MNVVSIMQLGGMSLLDEFESLFFNRTEEKMSNGFQMMFANKSNPLADSWDTLVENRKVQSTTKLLSNDYECM